ncbi:hypothetical protein BKA62DRAFT_401350 [Auriculariales sp. MPI-PUGE-AT-0066]|nr:hypothetical protein BKA62DRAFT_401350 [Auriculariales sp. MPI-PUGE-AT-0066]
MMEGFRMPYSRDTNLFQRVRTTAYICIIISSIVVLGIAAHLASEFLPTYHAPFIIFSLIASVLTFVLLIIMYAAAPRSQYILLTHGLFLRSMLRSTPRWDMVALFILAVLWLAMGAYSTDFIGYVECFALGGQTTPTKNGHSTSARSYCYELKTIQAFSWTNFGILTLAFIVLLCLVLRVLAHGRWTIWNESVSELPFFGQMGGFQGQPVLPFNYSYAPQQPYYVAQQQAYAGTPGYFQQPPGNVIMQQPGYGVMVQPQMAGQPPVITQVPLAPVNPAGPHSSVPVAFEA